MKSIPKLIGWLIVGWLSCVALAIIVHGRVFLFLGYGFLIAALIAITISIVYAFLPSKEKTKDKSCNHDPS